MTASEDQEQNIDYCGSWNKFISDESLLQKLISSPQHQLLNASIANHSRHPFQYKWVHLTGSVRVRSKFHLLRVFTPYCSVFWQSQFIIIFRNNMYPQIRGISQLEFTSKNAKSFRKSCKIREPTKLSDYLERRQSFLKTQLPTSHNQSENQEQKDQILLLKLKSVNNMVKYLIQSDDQEEQISNTNENFKLLEAVEKTLKTRIQKIKTRGSETSRTLFNRSRQDLLSKYKDKHQGFAKKSMDVNNFLIKSQHKYIRQRIYSESEEYEPKTKSFVRLNPQRQQKVYKSISYTNLANHH